MKNLLCENMLSNCDCNCIISENNSTNCLCLELYIGQVENPQINIISTENLEMRITSDFEYKDGTIYHDLDCGCILGTGYATLKVTGTDFESKEITFECKNVSLDGNFILTKNELYSYNHYRIANINQDTSAVSQEEFNDLANEVDGMLKSDDIRLYVLAEDNNATTTESSSVTLDAVLIDEEGLDVTANYPEDCYKWIRQSENMINDAIFNDGEHFGTTLIIDDDRTVATATYLCDFLFDEETGAGHIPKENDNTRVAGNTYYNMIYTSDNQYIGGTLSGYGYGTYISEDLNTFTGYNMDQTEILDYKIYVRKLGSYEVAFTKNNTLLEYWGTESGTTNNDLKIIDFVYTGTTIYRLSYDQETYNIHKMNTPVEELELIYSSADKIDWIAALDDVGLLFVSSNKVYEIVKNEDDEIAIEVVFDLFNLVGINKLIAHNNQFVVIARDGYMAYSNNTTTTGWDIRRLGKHHLVDITSDNDDLLCLINEDGQSYLGTLPNNVCMYKKFDKQPLSINLCGLYMVITYEGYIIYTKLITTFDLSTSSVDGACKCAVYNEGLYYLVLGDGYIYSGSKLSKLEKVTTIGNVEYIAVKNNVVYALYSIANTSDNGYTNGVKSTSDLKTWNDVGNTVVSRITPANYLFFDKDENLCFHVTPYERNSYVYKYDADAGTFTQSYTSKYECKKSAIPVYVNDCLYMFYSRNTVEIDCVYETTKDLSTTSGFGSGYQGLINYHYRVYDDGERAYMLYGNFLDKYSSTIYVFEDGVKMPSENFKFNNTTLDIAFIVKVGKWFVVGADDGYIYASENRVNWFRAFKIEEITTSSDVPRFVTAHSVNGKLIVTVYYLDGETNSYSYKLYYSK